jgi:hypothetical protein
MSDQRYYVNFRVEICPMYRIWWYSNLELSLLKEISGASGRTYIADLAKLGCMNGLGKLARRLAYGIG